MTQQLVVKKENTSSVNVKTSSSSTGYILSNLSSKKRANSGTYNAESGGVSIYTDPTTRFVKPDVRAPRNCNVVVESTTPHPKRQTNEFAVIKQLRSGIVTDNGKEVVYQAQTGIDIGAGLRRTKNSRIQKDLREVAALVAMRSSPDSPDASWSSLVKFTGNDPQAQSTIRRQLAFFGIQDQDRTLPGPNDFKAEPAALKWLTHISS